MANRNTQYDILDKILNGDLPPLTDEPNQAGIDAETARQLRAAAEERRQQNKRTDNLERVLRS